MTVSLPLALESWVENRVKNGLATSSDEVGQEALKVMILLEQAQTARLEGQSAMVLEPVKIELTSSKAATNQS